MSENDDQDEADDGFELDLEGELSLDSILGVEAEPEPVAEIEEEISLEEELELDDESEAEPETIILAKAPVQESEPELDLEDESDLETEMVIEDSMDSACNDVDFDMLFVDDEDEDGDEAGEKEIIAKEKAIPAAVPGGSWPSGGVAKMLTGQSGAAKKDIEDEPIVLMRKDSAALPELELELEDDAVAGNDAVSEGKIDVAVSPERSKTVLPERKLSKERLLEKASSIPASAVLEEPMPELPEEEMIVDPVPQTAPLPPREKKDNRKKRIKRHGKLEEVREIEQITADPYADEPEWGSVPERKPRPRSSDGGGRSWDFKVGSQSKTTVIAIVATVLVVILVAIFINTGDDDESGNGGSGQADSGETGGSGEGEGTTKVIDQSEAMSSAPLNVTEDEMYEYFNTYATETAKIYYGADTAEGRLVACRDPERVGPLMKEYYSRKPLSSGTCESVKLDGYEDVSGRTILRGTAMMSGNRRNLIVFEKTPTGLLVDWEYMVNYNPMPWDAYIADKPQNSLDFRVLATASLDYVAPFDNAETFLAVELRCLKTESTLLGYVARDSESGRNLKRILQNELDLPIILRLRFPSQGAPEGNAVVIELIVSESWIIVD